jgi:ComF family protein
MPLTRFEEFPCNPIEKLFWGRVEIQAASAYVYFTSGSAIQQSLHLLKYKGRKEIGWYFGRRMGTAIKNSGRFDDCEIILPLPLYAEREKKRGYNQSKVIADSLSAELKIPIVTTAVYRVKKTETQTHKNRIERWKNMEATFEIRDPQLIASRHLLIIDDVVTTGASLEACARELLKTKGVRVSICCLAHTVSS